jgi:hypothetical protein
MAIIIVAIGGVHVIASVENDLNGARVDHLARSSGRHSAHSVSTCDLWNNRLYYIFLRSVDAFDDGYEKEKMELASPRRSPAATDIPSDARGPVDVIHPHSGGRTWRNLGIWHNRTNYDPKKSPLLLESIRNSDAVLTEIGDYFEELQETSRSLGVPADYLGENRTRFSASIWARSVAIWSQFMLFFLLFCYIIYIILLRLERNQVKSSQTFRMATICLPLIHLICFVGVIISIHSTFWPILILDKPAAGSTAPTGMRALIDAFVESWSMTFDEACLHDSKSMYNNIQIYMDNHPGCRRLLIVTGRAHADHFESFSKD